MPETDKDISTKQSSRSFAAIRMTGRKGEGMTGRKCEGMAGLYLLLGQNLSRDAAAGKSGLEGGEGAIERRTPVRHDLGAERGAVDDLGSPGGVADDHGVRGLLDEELNV